METDRDISSTAWILGKVETEADWAHHTLFRYIFPITFLVGNFACSCQDFALPQYCFRVFLIFIYKMAAATKSSLYSIWWATQLLRGSSSSLGSVCYSWIASQIFIFFIFLKKDLRAICFFFYTNKIKIHVVWLGSSSEIASAETMRLRACPIRVWLGFQPLYMYKGKADS